jgi:N-acetylmuramoyl-L-alanine amidase
LGASGSRWRGAPLKTTVFRFILLCVLALPLSGISGEQGLAIKDIRYFSYAAFTRIVFEIESAAPYVLTKTEDGRTLLLSAYEGPLILKSSPPAVRDSVVSGIEAKEDAGRNVVIIRMNPAAGEAKDFVLRGPDRIVIDVQKGTPIAPVLPGKSAVVVVDAGHGGSDAGISAAQGLEKSMTLDLAHAVKRILQKNPLLKVIMTREKDLALTLEERAAAANSAGAFVFVSIHATPGQNGRVFIQDPDQDQDQDVGRHAPPPVNRDFLGFDAANEQQERLWGRQQAAHAKESGELGRVLARQLTRQSDAEPDQAPVAGLKAVDAAAVLLEVGMEQDRAKAAEAIAKGIEQYAGQNR